MRGHATWGGASLHPTTAQVRTALGAATLHYYPGYAIYYNTDLNQYVYQDGGNWVIRAEPPRGIPVEWLLTPRPRWR